MFHVGQKVVCVNDGPSRFTGKPTVVKRGEVYTITSYRFNNKSNNWGVLLAEIDPPGTHADFDAERFRPTVERKTDIGVFTAMLKPQKTDA